MVLDAHEIETGLLSGDDLLDRGRRIGRVWNDEDAELDLLDLALGGHNLRVTVPVRYGEARVRHGEARPPCEARPPRGGPTEAGDRRDYARRPSRRIVHGSIDLMVSIPFW